MEMEQILHMNGGEGEDSYANNSSHQKGAILKAKDVLEQSLNDLYCNGNGSFPGCIRFVDMGCSSGPNSLLPTWEAIDSLHKICDRLDRKPPPVLHAFLNDLPGNDFNTTFKSLPSFYERLRTEKGDESPPCFIAAAPGSFHGRLFPSNFLHLVYSSSALHWLSQAPKGIESESDVGKAYSEQFESDFTSFLKFRSEELKPKGGMVCTFMLKDDDHQTPKDVGKRVIEDMISEGLIEESKVKSGSSQDLYYPPYLEEVKQAIEREGSFGIRHLETFQLSWLAGFDESKSLELGKYAKGKFVADHVRAVSESAIANQLGDGPDADAILDEIFRRFAVKATDEVLEKGQGAHTVLLISLVKKQ